MIPSIIVIKPISSWRIRFKFNHGFVEYTILKMRHFSHAERQHFDIHHSFVNHLIYQIICYPIYNGGIIVRKSRLPDKSREISRFCCCYNQKQKKMHFAAFRFSDTGQGHKPKKLSSRTSSCLEIPFRFSPALATILFQPCEKSHGFFRFHARNPC